MRRLNSAAGVALSLLAGLMPTAAAPDQPDGEDDRKPPQITVEDEARSTRVVTQAEISIELELPSAKTAVCEATIAVTYHQRGSVARVEGTIDNPTCAASSGSYTLAISVRGENGERRSLEFPETWQRTDDRPVVFLSDYPIGEDVDLVSVRSRQVRCTCASAPTD